MNNLFKTLIAGYGAKKLGGGCLSTVLIFFVIYWALGTCNRNPQMEPRRGEINTHKTQTLPIAKIKY